METGQQLLQEVLDHLPDSVYVKDAQSRYVIGNLAHTRFLGLQSDAQVAGTTVFDYFPREQAEQFYADDQAVLRTGQPLIRREEPITRPGGEVHWAVTSKVPLRDREGRVVGLVAISRDVTDRKLAEERLREANASLRRREEELLQALAELRASGERLVEAQLQVAHMEKMRSVGRLAAGVAHEVKNPLAVIEMGLTFLDRCPPHPDAECEREAAEARRMMHDALYRADGVIRGLLDFAAPSKLHLEPRDLNAVVRRSLSLVSHDLVVRQIKVSEHLAPGLPPVPVDAGKVEQVLINLFTNAAHAMPAGGTLTVRTRLAPAASEARGAGAADSAGAAGATGAAATDHAARGSGAEGPEAEGPEAVFIEVEDTGTGIPEDLLPRIFEPFVTTKSADTGTGLGLTVTKTIVDLHGGKIELRNRPGGGGARATLTLNCAGPGSAAPGAEPTSAPPDAGSGT